MSSQLLAAKVVIKEEAPRIQNIAAVPTAVLGAVGITERGPVGVATLVTSFEEFVRIFGSFTANADLTLAMQGFFDNGGTTAWIVRTVHYTDITLATSKTSAAATLTLDTAANVPTSGSITSTNSEPYDLEPGDTLDIAVDGGGPSTATFNATAASRTSGNTETYDLVDGLTLTVSIDGGGVQTITFNTAEFADIANATAEEVAAVINAEITGASADAPAGTSVRITSDSRGTGSGVNVTGGTANTGGVNRLNFTTGNSPGTGNVADIDAVTVAEAKTIIEAAVAGLTVNDVSGQTQIVSDTTGASSSIQVQASSTADDEFGFDNATHSGTAGGVVNTLKMDGKTDGAYANDARIIIADATSGIATEFNLSVEDNGIVVEVFPNVTMDDTLTNFVETVVNDADTGSDLVAATDLDAGGTPTTDRPANGTFGPMTGGDDGLTSLDDNDFLGSDAGPTGLRVLDTISTIRTLAIPGRATSAVHNGMITYAEVTRDGSMLAVLDPPAGLTAAGIDAYVVTTASLKQSSEFAAIYWPRIKILNPNKTVFGTDDQITVAPSGHIAGVYANVDNSIEAGVFGPPAGAENGIIRGALDLETDEVLDEAKRDIIFPDLINPITTFEGTPIHMDGARTLKDTGNFPTIGERRGVIFVEQSVKNFLLFAKNQNNTAALRGRVRRSIVQFLNTLTKQGAFASLDPSQAFFVDVSEALNPPSVIFARQLRIRIGLATNKPAEFIIVLVSQDTRALEEELAAAS